MATPDQSTVRNLLFRAMSPDDFALLAPHLVRTHTSKGMMLFDRHAPLETAWFPENSLGSLVTVSREGLRVESGIFGRDGFAPVGLAMGSSQMAYEGIIQVPDDAFQLPAEVLLEAIGRSRTLHGLLLRYVQALSVQTSYTALSNAVHPIEERLARWLLMCHDRLDGDELPLTHEFMSIMLAVRRPSVTTSLHVLEGNGFIRAERGLVVVRNRTGLEEFAADGYGPPEREYERLVGKLR